MAIIQVQIGKNTIEYVLLDGGSRINFIIEQLKLRLGLPKPKPTPYNLRMAYQTTKKPMGSLQEIMIYFTRKLNKKLVILTSGQFDHLIILDKSI
jgi:hypothetical protein